MEKVNFVDKTTEHQEFCILVGMSHLYDCCISMSAKYVFVVKTEKSATV